MKKLQNYINGELVSPVNGDYLDNVDPSTGKVYSLIPDSDEKDANLAVAAAKSAFPIWSSTTKEERSKILNKIADLLESRLDQFAEAESLDNGKPVKLATMVDIPRAVSNIKFFVNAINHFASESHYMEGVGVNYTTRKPLGVVTCIAPWNLPLYLFTWKIAPALAAGNTVVAKPTEVTPLTAYMLSELCVEAGLPKGVLNIVHGLGHKIGSALTEHQDVKAISFTGGTATGKRIAEVAAPKFKKMSLELGGKNPNVIFDDCDFDKTLAITMKSSFANQGQICLCGSRIFVQRGIYEKFRDAFVAKTKKSVVSYPSNPKAHLGAVVSKPHMEKVLSYVDLAKEEGGTVLAGGHRVILEGEHSEGFYIAPTIIEGLSYDCRVNQEEIFGPVVTIMPFDTKEEALMYANSTEYGLASTVHTKSLDTANYMSDKLESGIVWINSWLVRDLRTPFGGVKSSGVGREGGWEALRFFTEPKNIFIAH
jgi:aminomuconate-semialdehyde/2-hydroxymuconate-6-semialdehyde dehydrogenase